MIGWISDDGLWLARGDEARRLQIGAAVLAWLTPDGALIKADGAQVKTELGWAGPETLGTDLDPSIVYRVLYPLGGMLLPNGEAPATSRAEFERGVARAMGLDPVTGLAGVVHRGGKPVGRAVGRASCECPSPVERRAAHPAIGA